MSDQFNGKYENIRVWVEEAKGDPTLYRRRKVTHILLHAVASSAFFREVMYLKGGVLMMLAHGSPRGTQDVDFTIGVDPEPFATEFQDKLDPFLFRSSRILGYFDILVCVQSMQKRPKADTFETATGAALKVKLGYAKRGTPEEKSYNLKKSSNVLELDLSFNEPLKENDEVPTGKNDSRVKSYTLEEIIAEKIRALLQQPIRKRYRRQDIYDISWIIDKVDLDCRRKELILEALLGKSKARNMSISVDSFDDPEVYQRANQDWETMTLEIGKLPDFKMCFEKVRKLYISLPWFMNTAT